MPTVNEDTDRRIAEAVELLRSIGPLSPAKLAEELGCSQTAAFRLLTLAANGRKWGPYIFQRLRGAEQRPLSAQYLYHDPRAVSSEVLSSLRSMQEQMFRLEAKVDAVLAERDLGPKQS